MVSTSANGNSVEINLNNREWYKGRRICPRCRINDAFGNFVHCAECLEKISENNIKYRDKRTEYDKRGNAAKKVKYAKRKRSGICTACGKKAQQQGQLCTECYVKRRKRRLASREYTEKKAPGEAFRERMQAGLCMYCGKPQVKGYKFCKEHLPILQERASVLGKNKDNAMRKEVEASWKMHKSKTLENI